MEENSVLFISPFFAISQIVERRNNSIQWVNEILTGKENVDGKRRKRTADSSQLDGIGRGFRNGMRPSAPSNAAAQTALPGLER